MGRSKFSIPFLNHLSGGLDYVWYCLPPQGRLGGILVGIHSATLIVNIVTNGDCYVKLYLKSCTKPDFLAELVRTCDNEESPMLIGVDFNILC
jgi:hypothetical protein